MSFYGKLHHYKGIYRYQHRMGCREFTKKYVKSIPKQLLNKEMAQHIVISNKVVHDITNSMNLTSNDTVLEIGCGSGNITTALLPKCKKVYAIDIDPILINILHRTTQQLLPKYSSKLHCIIGDALKYNIPNDIDHIISNAPYNISTDLIKKLCKNAHKFKSALMVFQKEFVNKMQRKPESEYYRRISVNSQLHFKMDKLFNIDKEDFKPKPIVNSSVIKLIPWIHINKNNINSYFVHHLKDIPSYKDINLNDYNRLIECENNEYIQWLVFLDCCFHRRNRKLNIVFQNCMDIQWFRLDDNHKHCKINDILYGTLNELKLGAQKANNLDAPSLLNLYIQFRKNGLEFFKYDPQNQKWLIRQDII